jgi:phytol kinase
VVPKLLKDKGVLSSFQARKLVHLAGLSVCVAPYLHYPVIAVIFSALMTVVVRVSGDKAPVRQLKELYDAIGEEMEREVGYLQGPFYYALAITLLMGVFLFLPNRWYYPIAAILIMIFADTLASIVGRRYGKHPITIKHTRTQRTVEGSLTMGAVSFVCCLATFVLFGVLVPGYSNPLPLGWTLVLSLCMAVLAPLVELVSPGKSDDLTIPFGSVALMVLLAVATGHW